MPPPGPASPRPPARGSGSASGSDFDLAVIGHGVVGLAVALACRDREPALRIVVIAPSDRDGAASPAAAAMLTSFAEIEPHTLAEPAGRARFELSRRSVPRWPAWIGRHADAAGLAPPRIASGVVVTASDPEIDGPALDAIRRAATIHEVDVESLEIRDVPGLRPRRSPPEAPAIRIPDEGSVDPWDVLSVLDAATRAAGIERRCDEAVGLDEGVVRLGDGSMVTADRVVVAAGARSTPLLDTHPELTGRTPRIRFGTGVGIRARIDPTTTIPTEVVRTPNRRRDHGVYFAPHGAGRFYIGATCEISDRPVETPRVAALGRILDAAMDDLSRDLGRATCEPVLGHRPTTDDGLPLLGPATERTWVASGTHRDGLASAPEISDRLAAAMLDGRPSLRPEWRPCRVEIAAPRTAKAGTP